MGGLVLFSPKNQLQEMLRVAEAVQQIVARLHHLHYLKSAECIGSSLDLAATVPPWAETSLSQRRGKRFDPRAKRGLRVSTKR